MKKMLTICAILIGALLQQLLPGWSLLGGIKPPILAALVVYYALRREKQEMWLTILLIALLYDGLEIGTFGPALLAFPIIAVVANRVRNEVFSDGLVTQMIFGVFASFCITFSALLIYTASGQRPFNFGLSLLRLFGSIWLGMATLPLVSWAISWLENALPKRREYGWQ